MHAQTPERPIADADLVEELIDAHLDTIELLLAGELDLERRGHLEYLQALARRAMVMIAHAEHGAALGTRGGLR